MAFQPSRLMLARQRRGRTKQDVAAAVDLAVPEYNRLEDANSVDSPPPAVVARLSAELRFPVGFFHDAEVESVDPSRASFRALAAMTTRQRSAALAVASIGFSVNEVIESDFNLPAVTVPDLTREDPAVAAAAVRAEWGLGVQSISNMVHLLEAHGVRVFSLAEDCREVDAFALWNGRTPFVFLNTLKSAEHGRWDAAHELGHLVLHRAGGNQGKEAELQANRFASAFLMPETNLRGIYGMCGLDDILRYKKRWGVSAVALVRRLYDAGLMPAFHYKKMFIEMSRRGWRSSEPEGLARETSQIFDKVFGFWRDRGLSQQTIADRLNLTLDELGGLVFGRILHTLQAMRRQAPDEPPPAVRMPLKLVR